MYRAAAIVTCALFFPVVFSAKQPCTTDVQHVVRNCTAICSSSSPTPPAPAGCSNSKTVEMTVRDVVRAIASSPGDTQRFIYPEAGEMCRTNGRWRVFTVISSGANRIPRGCGTTRGLLSRAALKPLSIASSRPASTVSGLCLGRSRLGWAPILSADQEEPEQRSRGAAILREGPQQRRDHQPR